MDFMLTVSGVVIRPLLILQINMAAICYHVLALIAR